MAVNRPKRENAGSRMTKLIEDAEEENEKDDIYKTAYGGFEEEECDDDYKSDEQAAEDSFDSDFSNSEVDDGVESEEDEKKAKKKPIKLFKGVMKSTASKASPATLTPKIKKLTIKKVTPAVPNLVKEERMRATTLLKASQVGKPAPGTVKRHPRLPQMRRLTQQELLAEAKITEEKNLASLAQIMKCAEEDKKNAKVTKPRYVGPIIRFQSVRMPLVDEHGNTDSNGGYCSRNFLEFTDTTAFPREYFPSKVRYPKKPVCAVTGLPAKYKDPLTGLPYATIEAFKYIREQRSRLKEQLMAKNNELKRKKKKDVLVAQ